MEILTDNNWAKGVFFRDPLRRLLSCYKDKFQNGTERSRKYSLKVFKEHHILTFEDFLEKVASPGAPQNVHWRPQADICQIGRLYHFYNVHGNFERIDKHAEVLLRRARLWDSFGAHGWGGGGSGGGGGGGGGSDAMFGLNTAAHRSTYGGSAATGDGSHEFAEFHSNLNDQHGAVARLVRRVKNAYRRDYALFSQLAVHKEAGAASQYTSASQEGSTLSSLSPLPPLVVEDPFDAALYFPSAMDSRRAVATKATTSHATSNDLDDDEVAIKVHESPPSLHTGTVGHTTAATAE